MKDVICHFCDFGKLADRQADSVVIYGIELPIPKSKHLNIRCPKCRRITKACRRGEKSIDSPIESGLR